MLNEQSKYGIKVEGYRGTWYIIDRTYHNGERVYLLESEQQGDEVAGLIVNSKIEIIVDEVWNGFDDLVNEGFFFH